MARYPRAPTRGKGNLLVGVGCALFGTATFLFPLMLSENRPSYMTLDYGNALDKQRQVRGPYVNTGSKDIGPDTKSTKSS